MIGITHPGHDSRSLLLDIQQAVKVKLTPEQKFEQKVSYIYSCLASSGITKEQIIRQLSK